MKVGSYYDDDGFRMLVYLRIFLWYFIDIVLQERIKNRVNVDIYL